MARRAGRTKGKLTVRQVATITAPGTYGDGGGLYLQVTSPQAKSWLFRYKDKWMGLGPACDVTLDDARAKAAEKRSQLREGVDPIAARDAKEKAKAEEEEQATVAAITFEHCAKTYVKTHRPSWFNAKHGKQWETTLTTYAFPVFGDVPVADVTQEQVLAVLSPIWTTKHETATRLRARIERVFEYAKAMKWRTAENPARWRYGLKELLPKIKKKALVKHHPALPFRHVPEFMAVLRAQSGMGALALEFTILCACRTCEALGARWSEIDMDAGVWVIPPERLKVKDKGPHKVPLSSAALNVLRKAEVFSQNDLVFPGAKEGRRLSVNAMLKVLERMQRHDITVHGFRSAFRDWAAEETHHPNEVCEAALAHTIRDASERAYRRGDLFKKRAALMQDWAHYCAGTASSNVVNLADAKRA